MDAQKKHDCISYNIYFYSISNADYLELSADFNFKVNYYNSIMICIYISYNIILYI